MKEVIQMKKWTAKDTVMFIVLLVFIGWLLSLQFEKAVGILVAIACVKYIMIGGDKRE